MLQNDYKQVAMPIITAGKVSLQVGLEITGDSSALQELRYFLASYALQQRLTADFESVINRVMKFGPGLLGSYEVKATLVADDDLLESDR